MAASRRRTKASARCGAETSATRDLERKAIEHSVHQRYASWIKDAQAQGDTRRVRELTAQRDADVRSELQRLDAGALQPLPLAPNRSAQPSVSSRDPWAGFSPR
jgi:hypothetical protein